MFRYLLVCLATVTTLHSTNGNPMTMTNIGDRELLLSIAANRHGERAPDDEELSLSNQQDKIKNLTFIEGPEGLTNMGKKRAYQLGKFYRERYGFSGYNLISKIYLRDEIAVRSTEKERTKMTIQVAMAAVYPPEPEQQWDEGLGKIWQPVPYTAVPLNEDYLRYYSNCKRFMQLMEEAQQECLTAEFDQFMDLIPLLLENTGRNFTENPLLFQSLFDLFKSTVNLNLELPEWSKPILARLGEAARLAYKLYYRNDEMRKIGGGVLLNNFIEAADDIIAGMPVTQRLRLFSSHDFNVGALMEVSRVKETFGIPDYGSVFALELYRSKRSGEYSVLPVYLPSAGNSSPQELRIIGCENYSHCDYSKFRELVKEFRLPEEEFYRICDIRTEM